jgi:NADH-quinone oxidoreductase subunit E
MCTGRVDLSFVLRALRRGADGVIIGGCWPGECHYVTEGNYDALGNMYLGRKLLGMIGVDPARLRLEWIAASEGTRFAEIMTDFAATVRDLGPIGSGEGVDPGVLRSRMEALAAIVPYVRLVEREKLRVGVKTVEAYRAFFESERTDALLRSLVEDKIAIGQIVAALRESPSTPAELAERLAMGTSDVGRYLNASSRQGLVEYDTARAQYVAR